MTAGRARDAGTSTAEYVGVVVLVAAVVAAVASAGVATRVSTAMSSAICSITGSTGCATSGGAADQSRSDAARDARGSRRDDARRQDPTTAPSPGTSGSSPAMGMGQPVPGESVPTPQPPAWKPVDAGAGAHGSQSAGATNYATKALAEAGANALGASWPHASRNLLHFLGNSGTPLTQDVNQILTDVAPLKDKYTQTQDRLGAQAVDQAKAQGATGPVTFPVSTAWTGFYIDKGMSSDWFYALGGIQYSVVGQVTVYPPATPGGQWTYQTTTKMVLRDQYNWDGGKATEIGPLTVTDEQLAELHRAGLAQEFTATGESSTTSRKGSV